MRAWMLILAVLLTPAASALADEELDFSSTYYLRGAPGDVPRTEATEADGFWNQVEYLRVEHDGNNTFVPFEVPTGWTRTGADCTCSRMEFIPGGVQIGISDPAGSYVVAIHTSRILDTAMTVHTSLMQSGTVVLYTPMGSTATSSTPLDAGYPLQSTAEHPGLLIHQFSNVPAGATFHVAPVGAVQAPMADEGFDWLTLLGGLLVGAVAWAILVQAGMVQKRSRKQVAATASHETLREEPRAVLEGRKRLLMAALKDLEMAKMNQEIDTAAYDVLKAEFKRETVSVMRALES